MGGVPERRRSSGAERAGLDHGLAVGTATAAGSDIQPSAPVALTPARDEAAWARVVWNHKMYLSIAKYKAKARKRQRDAASMRAFEARGGRAALSALIEKNHAEVAAFMGQFNRFASANQMNTIRDPNASSADKNDAIRFMLQTGRRKRKNKAFDAAIAAIDAAAAEWMAGKAERDRKAAAKRAEIARRQAEIEARGAAVRALREAQAAEMQNLQMA